MSSLKSCHYHSHSVESSALLWPKLLVVVVVISIVVKITLLFKSLQIFFLLLMFQHVFMQRALLLHEAHNQLN